MFVQGCCGASGNRREADVWTIDCVIGLIYVFGVGWIERAREPRQAANSGQVGEEEFLRRSLYGELMRRIL